MKKILMISIMILLLTAVYGYTQMGPGMMGPGMMNWGYGMGWGWMIIMAVFWISVIVGIIFLIRWVVLSANKDRGLKHEETALDILKKRYAKGEINKDEFEEKKKDLI
jgi:putative membrane protein